MLIWEDVNTCSIHLKLRCVDIARRNAVDVDPSTGPLTAQCLCDLSHSCLGGIVGHLLLWVEHTQGCHAGNVDDLAIVLRQHMLAFLLCCQQ